MCFLLLNLDFMKILYMERGHLCIGTKDKQSYCSHNCGAYRIDRNNNNAYTAFNVPSVIESCQIAGYYRQG